jgi:hypothetical protein
LPTRPARPHDAAASWPTALASWPAAATLVVQPSGRRDAKVSPKPGLEVVIVVRLITGGEHTCSGGKGRCFAVAPAVRWGLVAVPAEESSVSSPPGMWTPRIISRSTTRRDAALAGRSQRLEVQWCSSGIAEPGRRYRGGEKALPASGVAGRRSGIDRPPRGVVMRGGNHANCRRRGIERRPVTAGRLG